MNIQKITTLIDQIYYCESVSNYTWIYFNDGSKVLVSKTLKSLQLILLNGGFIRVHYKYLVNVRCIIAISSVNYHLLLINNTKIPIARRRWTSVKSSIHKKRLINNFIV